jgi:hypothetical protein
MTRAEAAQAARKYRYERSERSWLERSAAAGTSNELSLADLTFRGDRLVALRMGTYDPLTRQVRYRDVDLCVGTPPRAPVRQAVLPR